MSKLKARTFINSDCQACYSWNKLLLRVEIGVLSFNLCNQCRKDLIELLSGKKPSKKVAAKLQGIMEES